MSIDLSITSVAFSCSRARRSLYLENVLLLAKYLQNEKENRFTG